LEGAVMKNIWLAICSSFLINAHVHAGDVPVLDNPKDKLSYSIGVSVARNIKKQETDVNQEMLIKGIHDALAGEKTLITEKEMRNLMNEYQGQIRQKFQASKRMALEDNKKKGEAFLAANKLKEGVVTLASGVQYKVIKAGSGRKPVESDQVACYYTGTLLDGTEFDGTEDGHPAYLKVAALIQGWKEALKLMAIGSKWQIFIPAQHAYGVRGVGSDIGPNETLIFEVELLDIK
jgi:FKBP-type peptidyl-prolyl cis-trans isomerase